MAVTNYIDFKSTDQFLLDSYTGKGGYLSGQYLTQHLRESDDKFTRRLKNLVYPNFCRKITDVFMGFLWQQSPNRTVPDDLYAQFVDNCDNQGGKLDQVLASYQRLAMLLGTVFVIVDKPQTQGATRAEQAMPYLSVRLKHQLINEIKDRHGVWQSVTFCEDDEDGGEQYRTFTTTEWFVSKDADKSEIIEQGTHSLGKVPVVRLHIAKPLLPCDTCAETFFYDLAILNWKLYNLESELRELERAQVFSILTVPAASKEERERLTSMKIGTDNGLVYDPTGGGKPDYIAPPSDPTEHYLKRMEQTKDTIYQVANLEFVGGVQQSGVALDFHFRECNSGLRTMAEQCEAAEREVAELVYGWQGSDFEGSIAYANDFNLQDVAKAIGVALDSIPLSMGETYEKSIKKRLAKGVLGNDVDQETLTQIDVEIDAMGDLYQDQLTKEALM